MKTQSSLVFLALAAVLVGCANGNCRSQRPPVTDEKTLATYAAQGTDVAQSRIKVFKYDGSLQCGQGKATSLVEMQKQLGTIVVFGAENKADGLMHIQACGTPTGKANVYQIEKTQLEAASKLGFREWTFD